MRKDREPQPLNKQPDLLKIDFPTKEIPEELPDLPEEEVNAWFNSLSPVPPERIVEVDKLVQEAIDSALINLRRRPDTPSSN